MRACLHDRTGLHIPRDPRSRGNDRPISGRKAGHDDTIHTRPSIIAVGDIALKTIPAFNVQRTVLPSLKRPNGKMNAGAAAGRLCYEKARAKRDQAAFPAAQLLIASLRSGGAHIVRPKPSGPPEPVSAASSDAPIPRRVIACLRQTADTSSVRTQMRSLRSLAVGPLLQITCAIIASGGRGTQGGAPGSGLPTPAFHQNSFPLRYSFPF